MTTPFAERSEADQIDLLTALAAEFLHDFGVGGAALRVINHGYNTTFAVDGASGPIGALRLNVNSPRTTANLAAEVAWMTDLAASGLVSLPRPLPTASGAPFATRTSEVLERPVNAVFCTWLPGQLVHTLEDPRDALRAAGRLLAHLHAAGQSFNLPDGAALPSLRPVLFNHADVITENIAGLSVEDHAVLVRGLQVVEETLGALHDLDDVQVIHADVHGGNLMWQNDTLSVFDFDDSGIGLPIQDLGISLSYLPDDALRSLVLEGYEDVAPLPPHREGDLQVLIAQRKIQLVNYIASSSNPAHREHLPHFVGMARAAVEGLVG